MDTNKQELSPKISVILPVFNAEPYLKECLESLKTQRFRDFEVLIFDDASTDRSHGILMAFDDPRFHVERSRQNQGYAVYLNQGIEKARGRYIARMDADDICHPERLQKQFEFLESHPEVGICGTGYQVFGSVEEKEFQKPLEDAEIRWRLMLDNPFQHPTVMIRRSVLIEHALRYREDLMPTEDYDLWSRLLKVTKGANLPEVLLKYRFHAGQESSARRERQLAIHEKVATDNVNALYEMQEREFSNEGMKAGKEMNIHWAICFRMGVLQRGETTVGNLIGYGDFVRDYFNYFPEGAEHLKRVEQKGLEKLFTEKGESWRVMMGWMLCRPKVSPGLLWRWMKWANGLMG